MLAEAHGALAARVRSKDSTAARAAAEVPSSVEVNMQDTYK